jgi:hypothetical protein
MAAPLIRVFSGQRYVATVETTTRKAAMAKAKQLKRRGWLTRIAETVDGYTVYTRRP